MAPKREVKQLNSAPSAVKARFGELATQRSILRGRFDTTEMLRESALHVAMNAPNSAERARHYLFLILSLLEAVSHQIIQLVFHNFSKRLWQNFYLYQL